MLALQITSVKSFMNRLLAGDTFDIFLLEEAVISTAITYTIDGHINTDFYPAEERESITDEFQSWSELKGLCFNLIKGRRTPLYFKFVLHLKPEKTNTLLSKEHSSVDSSQVRGLILTIKYEGSKVILTTGTSYHTFVMDKEPDRIWDKAIVKYLSGKGIPFEEL